MNTTYRNTTEARMHDDTADGASRVKLPPDPAPEAQAPLGPEPSYDEVLDVAVEYSFPCSDPIAVQSRCDTSADRVASTHLRGNNDPDKAADNAADNDS